jgi:hypothetical protein
VYQQKELRIDPKSSIRYHLTKKGSSSHVNTHKNKFFFKRMMTSSNDLATSLLGNIPQHECDDRNAEFHEEEGCTTCCVDDDNLKLEDSKSGSIEEDMLFFSFALHALLFVQFSMAFSTFPIEATTGLSWSVVKYCIILHVITTTIYRQAAKDCKSTCSAIILLPEIFIDIMLVLVLLNKAVTAFLFLLVSMLCLTFLVVANSIRVLIVTVIDESECDNDLQQPEDELDVSYFIGGRVRTMQTM